jgi:hypothetical protein
VAVTILRTVVAGAIASVLSWCAVAIHITWRAVAVLAALVTVLIHRAGTITVEIASSATASTASASTTPTPCALGTASNPVACFIAPARGRRRVGGL